MTPRDPIDLPHARLSLQGSSFHYCAPRKDGLALTDYTAVEVGILGSDGLCRPSDTLGPIARKIRFLPRTRLARDLDRLFEDGGSPVAGYVSWDDVARIGRFLS